MDINRSHQSSRRETLRRLEYVLDTLEGSDGFSEDLGWKTEVTDGVTLEELIGAAVDAEDHIREDVTNV